VIAGYRSLLDAGHPASAIAFGGESIGGGTLALAVLPAARDSGLPLPASAFALSPLTDLTLSSPAITAPADRDPLGRDGRQFEAAVRDYLPPGQDPAAPLVSPLYADWTGLPAVHIEVGSTERLIDDARRLIERARLAGVPATLEVTEGAVHAFPATAPDTPEAKAAIERIGRHLAACLETPGRRAAGPTAQRPGETLTTRRSPRRLPISRGERLVPARRHGATQFRTRLVPDQPRTRLVPESPAPSRPRSGGEPAGPEWTRSDAPAARSTWATSRPSGVIWVGRSASTTTPRPC
jgi:hypothetical protein